MHEEYLGEGVVAASTTRRKLWRVTAGGVAVVASGLLPPVRTTEAAAHRDADASRTAARDNASAEGRRRRRHRHRKHQRHGLFRNSALTVVNKTGQTLNCAFYFRVQTGPDDYGLPVLDVTQAIAAGASFRYAHDHFRVGVLVRQVDPGVDLYTDVRNLSIGYPRGGVTTGAQLDPASSNFGSGFIPEEGYSQGEQHKRAKIVLKRRDDSADFIEWELTVGEFRGG
jgi:hypothetical protein